jgi:hypothetical protein
MKNFLKGILFFFIPIFLIFGGIEFYVRNSPNAFITKSEYLKNNLDNISTLVLGTSHSQNGINPAFFKKETANISYGSQDIATDALLLMQYAPQMKNLKTVIFEYDYHRMDIDNDESFYRLPWYFIYYGIEVKPIPANKKFSLYFSNPDFFNNIIISRLKGKPKQVINKYGFVEKNYSNDFEKYNYDEFKILKSASKRLKGRHTEFSEDIFSKNKALLIKCIEYCKSKNIRIIFVSSPLYKTYITAENPLKKKRITDLMNDLVKNYKVEYYDFSNNDNFKLKDFSNDDHLNAEGAKKYTLILNSLLK